MISSYHIRAFQGSLEVSIAGELKGLLLCIVKIDRPFQHSRIETFRAGNEDEPSLSQYR